jgi:probable rRNA maturation factor
MHSRHLEIVPHCTLVEVDLDLAREALEIVCSRFAIPAATISLVIADDRLSQRLHRQFLAMDEPTDVLTFPLTEHSDHVQGEIVVNAELAQRAAPQVGWSAAEELLLYYLHGLLHLAGLDDQETADQVQMFQVQRDILIELGLAPELVRCAVRLTHS